MNSIAIHTYDNDLFRQRLEQAGFSVTEMPAKPEKSLYYILESNLLINLSRDFFPSFPVVQLFFQMASIKRLKLKCPKGALSTCSQIKILKR